MSMHCCAPSEGEGTWLLAPVSGNCGCVNLCAVSRIKAKGDLYEMDLLLDVNTDLYPMDVRTCASTCCDMVQLLLTMLP